MTPSKRTSVGAASNGNYVSVEIGDGVPVTVIADGNRLRQVMLNLLSNVQKFTKGGEIAVSLVRTGDFAGQAMVEFSVTDTGPGFDPALAENLFRDFTTLDASYQRETGGSGLGLAISRRIIEAMGGEIGAEGRPGEGSRFWFRVALPVSAAAEKAVAEIEAVQDRLKILVAEDNSTNLLVTRQMLQSAGHRVEDARNGAEAVERAEADRYDLILMDISMPGMDGIEATRAISAGNGPSRLTPVIALTANAIQEGVEHTLAAGMNNYLSKPIRRADLIAAIEAIVEENKKAMNDPVFDETHYQQLCHDITAQSAREVLQTFLGELAGRHDELRSAKERGDRDCLWQSMPRHRRSSIHGRRGGALNAGAQGRPAVQVWSAHAGARDLPGNGTAHRHDAGRTGSAGRCGLARGSRMRTCSPICNSPGAFAQMVRGLRASS